MRGLFNTRNIFIFFLVHMLFYPWCQALTLWHDNPNINTNVIDDDIDISGTNVITGRVYVEALTQDIDVSVTTNDSVVTSSLQLHFFADLGRTITFDLENDLMFRGSSGDFLITFSGRGTMDVRVMGSKALRFTSLPTSGGAQFFILENSTDTPPHVIFERFPIGTFPLPEPNLNSYVQVGPRSLISFAAPTALSTGLASETGLITFNPTNTAAATGRLVLQLENNSSVVIDGHLVSNMVAPSLTDIDVTIAAGLQSRFNITNSDILGGAWAGLMIVNRNTVWSQLKIDPFCEGDLTTIRHGFVLGAGGILETEDQTYLDYVVTVTNVSPDPNITATVLNNPCQRFVENIVKDRNPAALIIDGDLETNASHAQVLLNGHSAIYFRSGVDCDGISTISDAVTLADQLLSFTIDPKEDLHTEGSIVLDVEGLVDFIGTSTGESALNILSIQVAPSGGSILIEGTDITFPLRTYARDSNGDYLQYGSASFLINNRMNLIETALQHTDVNHKIFVDNVAGQSAPTYVGGDSRTIKCTPGGYRNEIAFYNSDFLVHTSFAATGMDWKVPNMTTGLGNVSTFIFYNNGYCIDDRNGRQAIFGTEVGSTAQDYATIVNRDSHLDVMQDQAGPANTHMLRLAVAPNNAKVTEGLTGSITDQFSVHTLFLGHASNISIGTNAATGTDVNGNTFTLTTFPTFSIGDSYFSFTSQGGTINSPELSMTTGEGGMFVDGNGIATIENGYRAAFSMDVTKSRNGVISFPKEQVYFGPRVGIAQWLLNLDDPTQLEIIGSGQNYSSFTIDWSNTKQDFCTGTNNVPYELASIVIPGAAPAVTHENLIGLPSILGRVNQLQIKNSLLGNQAQFIVDGSEGGGIVDEVVFLVGNKYTTVPTAFIVVQNRGIVGIGNANRTSESVDSAVVLGFNGVTIVAGPEGGTVVINSDTNIQTTCALLTSTLFGLTDVEQLVIQSSSQKVLRVQSDGVLDLSQFNTSNKQVVIGGNLKLVIEPGAKVLLGGGDLIIADQAIVEFDPFMGNFGTGIAPAATDDFRAKFLGTGRVILTDDAQMLIPQGAVVGVETDPLISVTTTSLRWSVEGASALQIGTDQQPGGTFQVGNTSLSTDDIISFSLVIDGVNARVEVNSQGFLGFGVGQVDKQSTIPDEWRVGALFNLNTVNLIFTQGIFSHRNIYPGSDSHASLIGFGPDGSYSFSFDRIATEILGGGNLILTGTQTFLNPVVGTTDGVINSQLSVGLMSSKATLLDMSKTPNDTNPAVVVAGGSSTALFNYLKMNSYALQAGHTAAISLKQRGQSSAAYVDGTTINRPIVGVIRSANALVPAEQVLAIGAVGLTLSADSRAPAYSALNP